MRSLLSLAVAAAVCGWTGQAGAVGAIIYGNNGANQIWDVSGTYDDPVVFDDEGEGDEVEYFQYTSHFTITVDAKGKVTGTGSMNYIYVEEADTLINDTVPTVLSGSFKVIKGVPLLLLKSKFSGSGNARIYGEWTSYQITGAYIYKLGIDTDGLELTGSLDGSLKGSAKGVGTHKTTLAYLNEGTPFAFDKPLPADMDGSWRLLDIGVTRDAKDKPVVLPAAVVRLSNGRNVQMGGKFVYTAKKDMSTVTLAGVDADKGSKLSLWYVGNAEAGDFEPVAVVATILGQKLDFVQPPR